MIPAARVEVDGVEVTCEVELGVSIAHGRSSTVDQPEPATASFDFVAITRATVDRLRMNSLITLDAVFGDLSTSRRFVGRITDVAVSWDTVDRASVKVVAASTVAMLGRTFIGDTPWPAELDGDRAAHILTSSPVPIAQIDPGTLNILARDVDRQPMLALLRELADDASGMVWHTRGGAVAYADSEHRRNTPSSLTLDACDILLSPVWELTTEGLTNEVRVSYGVIPEGGEQAQALALDTSSITEFGRMESSISTKLAAEADAQRRADVMIARGAQPSWNLTQLPVELALPSLDEARTRTLLGLELHDLITVTGLPSQGPETTQALWVEGWGETVGLDSWTLVLAVSSFCRTAAFLRWDDTPADISWDEVDLTWDQVTCIGPTPDLGRWNDVPANTRWDTVPPSVTWDSWGG